MVKARPWPRKWTAWARRTTSIGKSPSSRTIIYDMRSHDITNTRSFNVVMCVFAYITYIIYTYTHYIVDIGFCLAKLWCVRSTFPKPRRSTEEKPCSTMWRSGRPLRGGSLEATQGCTVDFFMDFPEVALWIFLKCFGMAIKNLNSLEKYWDMLQMLHHLLGSTFMYLRTTANFHMYLNMSESTCVHRCCKQRNWDAPNTFTSIGALQSASDLRTGKPRTSLHWCFCLSLDGWNSTSSVVQTDSAIDGLPFGKSSRFMVDLHRHIHICIHTYTQR